jgi:hypothetical protein
LAPAHGFQPELQAAVRGCEVQSLAKGFIRLGALFCLEQEDSEDEVEIGQVVSALQEAEARLDARDRAARLEGKARRS